MQSACVFCDVIEGREPSAIVFADERSMAFLDVKPLFKGHVLVVPRVHVETLDVLPDVYLEPLFAVTRRISRAVRYAAQAEGSFVAMNNRVSQSVPHLHVHVVPRRKGDGLRGFFWRGKSTPTRPR